MGSSDPNVRLLQ